MNWLRYLQTSGVPKWYAARTVLLLALTKSITSSSDLILWTITHGSVTFFCTSCGLRVCRSMIAPLASCDMRRTPLSFCRSAMNDLRPFSLLLDFSALPLSTISPPSRAPMACRTSACRKSFLVYSLTKMTSGAYGLFPPKAKRAFTSALAASSKSACLSTIARVVEEGIETIWFESLSPSKLPF